MRANTLRTRREELAATFAREGIETEPTPHAPDGLIVISGNPLRARTDGSFLVQDEASQLVSYAVGARPDEHVLDLCASPGNKTVAMAADMRNTGLLVACDVRPRRIKLLNTTVHAAWATRVRVVHLSASGELPFQRYVRSGVR